jgi:eukaryotic-like serine/threonine-protein kinase
VGSRVILERLAWLAITAGLAAVVIWTQLGKRTPPEAFAPPHRATIVLPDGVALVADGSPGAKLALSPDGNHLAFVGAADRGPLLWLQSLNETTARSIEGSEGASAPFWSPDGRILAFHRNDQILLLDVYGAGRVTGFADGGGTAAWIRGPSTDLILTATSRPEGAGIRTLSPQSRAAADLLVAKPSEVYSFPASLFDGRRFLFTYDDLDNPSTTGVYVGTVGTSEKVRVLSLDSSLDNINSYYASGYLLTVRNQSILARPFDPKTLTVGETAAEVAAPVFGLGGRGAAFSVSQNGVIVYQSAATDHSRLVIQDRKGQVLRTLSDDAGYSNLELSPDGSQLAVSVPDAATQNRDIWVIDIVRGVRTRVTFDPSDERSVVWSLDGKSLIYRSKAFDLYTRTLGAAAETPLVTDGLSKDPRGWSPDGEFFVYRVTGNAGRNDLWIKPRDPARKPYPFLATPFDENYGSFSPDGRWMAYVSNESGRPEVYATSFPSGEGKWQVSTNGGLFPRWRRDMKEIVYLSLDNKLMSAAINGAGSSLEVSAAEMLFQTRAAPGPGAPFDMTADGQRFIVNTDLPSTAPPALVVVYNWPALIEK